MFLDKNEDKDEITISDVTSAEFEELLKVVQPGSRMELSRSFCLK